MKLQKLKIHNIASIEDATIDFEAQPLAGSEVFLITGITGSGKSTILDSICLALYDNTPRLKNSEMQGKTPDADDDVPVGDVRQIMRRNTVEASVELNFIGNNGIAYCAKWSVRRSRKKLKGQLQKTVMELDNLTDGTTLTGKNNVKAELSHAIGLSFEEFCRTTLLAQGEFTRFLNSKDEDKASILEKITGVDIYTKIGAKVYEMEKESERQWREAKRRIEDIQTFTDEEIEGMKSEMDACARDYEKARNGKDADDKKLQWIKRRDELEQGVVNATRAYEIIKAEIDSDEFKSKEILLEQRNATGEARLWLMNKQAAEHNAEENRATLENLSGVYCDVLAGVAFEKQRKQRVEAEIEHLGTVIDADRPKSAVFEQTQTIVGHLSTIVECRKRVAKEQENLRTESKKLDEELRPAFNEARAKAEQEKAAFEKKEKTVVESEQEVEAMNLPSLYAQRAEVKDNIQNIKKALDDFEALKEQKEQRSNTQARLEKDFEDVQQKEQKLVAIKVAVHDAQVKLETSKSDFEKHKDSIDKFAVALRHKLHKGDKCPVCGQAISADLPHEDEFSALVESLQASYKEKEKEYNEIVQAQNRLEAEIKAQKALWAREKESFDNDNAVELLEQRLSGECRRYGYEITDDAVDEQLKTLKGEQENAVNELQSKIEQCEQKEREVKKLRKLLEKKRSIMNQLNNEAQTKQNDVRECESRITTANQLKDNWQTQLNGAESDAALLITGEWTVDWRENPKEFGEMLKAAAKSFADHVKQKQDKEQQLSDMATNMGQTNRAIEKTVLLMPQWKNAAAPHSARELRDLPTKANDLYASVREACQLLKQSKENIEKHQILLDEFYANHDDISESRLIALAAYTDREIEEVKQLVSDRRRKELTQKTLLLDINRQKQEHLSKPIEINEEDTIETLAGRIAETEKLMAEINVKKGLLQQKLKDDEENKRRLGDLIREADEKNAVYLKWGKLSNLIGDSNGKVFRKIAQSYVLATLINTANGYMKTLTNRYTLRVVPGSFTITVEDAYQGYINRAASTISGGESFLVSLALALALSDIGQQLAVDTLFIDEGFGSLSGEPLQNAINTLHLLHSKSGRHVGIISHVEELQSKIPVQILVERDKMSSCSSIKVKRISI